MTTDAEYFELLERLGSAERAIRLMAHEIAAMKTSAPKAPRTFEASDFAIGVTEHGDVVYAIAPARPPPSAQAGEGGGE